MGEFHSNRRIVKLDNVQQNNIVIADLSQSLSETVFEQQYKKSAEIIRKIIAEGRDKATSTESNCRFCKSRSCSSCRFRDYSDCNSGNRRKYNRTQFQTAVPFIGERGSGKTSVLCSVLDYLSSFRGNGKEDAAFYLGSENDDVRFITLDMIDANMLKCTEDVMEIILSRMLTYLEEIQSNTDFRELYRQIDELHRDLGLIYWKKPEARDGYGLTPLQRVADSQKVIDNFSKLVDQFTQDVSRYKFGNKKCFLVISLDDIDMYMGAHSDMWDGQFTLLEQIYNHMRTPGLIVLMTYNEHILRRKCNEHFANIYFGSEKPKEWERSQSAREDVETLTAQFMSKIFPQERRVYLPNYVVVDSENRSNLYVQPTLTEKGKEKIIPPFTSVADVPVKEFMLRLIAHRTGVYFDSAGTKQHFFEPRNLRELGEMFQVLNSMERVDSEEVPEEVKRRNRQELMDYLYNQYALRYLNTEEYRRFQRLSMLPLERQNKTIVDQIRQQREIVVTSKDSIGYLDKTERDRWKYSYGELIHNMYFSTRIAERGSEKTFYSKEFMHCILGTHSVLLNQLVQGSDFYEELRKIIGSSIAGRWANEMLPKFSDKGTEATAAGSLSLPVGFFINWIIPEKIQNALLNLDKDNCEKVQKALSQYIEAMVLVGMFFTGFPHNGLKIKPVLERDEDGACVIYLQSESEDHICFNVLNCVINLCEAFSDENSLGYLPYMKEKIKKLGEDFATKSFQTLENARIKAEKEKAKADANFEEMIRDRIETMGFDSPYNSEAYDRERKKYHRGKSYTEVIAKAEEWGQLLNAYKMNAEIFLVRWNAIVDDVFERIGDNIAAWQKKYEQFPAVLPVQHFDMMYNIIKRLAHGSYYDIPEEAALEEIYDYYVRFYERVAEELKKQDDVYFVNCGQSFSKAFKESFFFMAFTADGPSHNPYIKQILVEMMQCALPAQRARKSQRLSASRAKSLWLTEEK